MWWHSFPTFKQEIHQTQNSVTGKQTKRSTSILLSLTARIFLRHSIALLTSLQITQKNGTLNLLLTARMSWWITVEIKLWWSDLIFKGHILCVFMCFGLFFFFFLVFWLSSNQISVWSGYYLVLCWFSPNSQCVDVSFKLVIIWWPCVWKCSLYSKFSPILNVCYQVKPPDQVLWCNHLLFLYPVSTKHSCTTNELLFNFKFHLNH